jgi:peptide/nickel transport system permease protein
VLALALKLDLVPTIGNRRTHVVDPSVGRRGNPGRLDHQPAGAGGIGRATRPALRRDRVQPWLIQAFGARPRRAAEHPGAAHRGPRRADRPDDHGWGHRRDDLRLVRGRAARGPSAAHLLGTDHLGRDELSRLLVAARTSLTAIVLVVAGAILIGLVIGTLAGFFDGLVDTVLSRVIDVGMSVPSLIVALTFIGVAGTGYANMVLALTVAWWPSYARLVRATVRGVRGRPHIEAIRVLGATPVRVLFRHLVPAAVGPVLVYGSVDSGAVALAVASLSFLGLGVQPPTPEWGQMVIDGRQLLDQQPLLVILPGVAITLIVIGFNLLGEAIARSDQTQLSRRRLLRVQVVKGGTV